jgi:Zn-finger nucleic acid-binding protein
MWVTPAQLDQLEHKAFDSDAEKGSLYLTSEEAKLKCPICSELLRQFDYRFFDLQLDCCPEHGFWLEKDQDDKILELMSGEEARLERDEQAENTWSKFINHLRSPSFLTKVKDLFKG